MKKAFSLIELLLAVVILSIMFLGVSNFTNSLNQTKKIMDLQYQNISFENKTYKLIYYDILKSDFTKFIQKKNYTILIIQTFNSLYKIPKPFVVWYVSKKNNSLMRLETPSNPFKKGNQLLKVKNYYLDKFLSGVEIFKVYKKNNKVFVFIKAKQSHFFEMVK